MIKETERELSCLRCGTKMDFLGNEDIQLGHHSLIFGDLGNLLAGSISADIYVCPNCKKIELYLGEDI